MDKRLTQKDEQGNWSLKGVRWDDLHIGQKITKNTSEKLYGALWKLMEYEDVGLTPDGVECLNTFDGSQAVNAMTKLQEERRKHRWIPVSERLPEDRTYLCTLDGELCGIDEPFTGMCGIKNGIWDAEDCVIAWMPLPEPCISQNQKSKKGGGD